MPRFMLARYKNGLLLLALFVLLPTACNRQGTPPSGNDAAQADAPAVPASAPVVLEDVIERDPRYIIGISYPPVAREDAGLAALLKAYADAARAELETAVQGLGGAKPAAPYDLSLGFTEVVANPDIVAVAANGSSYTGGAHGNPLVARFVWLPRQDTRLTADTLLADPSGWETISAYVRAHGEAMLDEGTAPLASNFDQFEPVMGAGGRIAALRFVFAPYQVAPYAAGVQTMEVPATVLLPLVASRYRGLFEGG